MYKILIIDDIQENIELIKNICSRIREFEILEATSCTKAIHNLKHSPDLIFLDVMIPQSVDEEYIFPKNSEGFFLYLWIQKKKKIPTIVATSRNDDKTKDLAKIISKAHFPQLLLDELGFYYFDKPINTIKLKDFVTSYFALKDEEEKNKDKDPFFGIIKELVSSLNHYLNHFSSVLLYLNQNMHIMTAEDIKELDYLKHNDLRIRKFLDSLNINIRNLGLVNTIENAISESIDYIQEIEQSVNDSLLVIYKRNMVLETYHNLNQEERLIAEEMENFGNQSISVMENINFALKNFSPK